MALRTGYRTYCHISIARSFLFCKTFHKNTSNAGLRMPMRYRKCASSKCAYLRRSSSTSVDQRLPSLHGRSAMDKTVWSAMKDTHSPSRRMIFLQIPFCCLMASLRPRRLLLCISVSVLLLAFSFSCCLILFFSAEKTRYIAMRKSRGIGCPGLSQTKW